MLDGLLVCCGYGVVCGTRIEDSGMLDLNLFFDLDSCGQIRTRR